MCIPHSLHVCDCDTVILYQSTLLTIYPYIYPTCNTYVVAWEMFAGANICEIV